MLKKLSAYTLALLGLTFIFSSCKKDYESIQSIDTQKISDYISANSLAGMVADSAKTGYYYQIVTQGTTGNFLKNTDSILYDGVVKGMENQTTYFSTTATANLGTYVGYTNYLGYNSVSYSIPAIREVMHKLKRGGTARILLPSYLAFGKNGAGSIPSNENIDLTITTYPDTTQAQLDDRLIQKFISSKGLSMVKDPSGVYYSISAAGSGTYPITSTATVEVSYTARLTDNTVVDSNTDLTIAINSAIKGWQTVIPGKLERGGKMRMLIPSALAYGTSGSGTAIPANAILDFDVEILSVTQ